MDQQTQYMVEVEFPDGTRNVETDFNDINDLYESVAAFQEMFYFHETLKSYKVFINGNLIEQSGDTSKTLTQYIIDNNIPCKY